MGNHIFFIHSSVHRHLGGFHILVIVNNAAVNIGCMYLFGLVFLIFFLDILWGVEMLRSYGGLIFSFWETSIVLSTIVYVITLAELLSFHHNCFHYQCNCILLFFTEFLFCKYLQISLVVGDIYKFLLKWEYLKLSLIHCK